MKILVTGTAGFIGYHLAKKLLERGDEVVGLDNINDYYDVNLKHARLNELGIKGTDALASAIPIHSSKYKNHKFIKLDLADKEGMDKLFKEEKFDAVMNLAAQAGVILDKSFTFAIRVVKLYKHLCDDKKEYVLSKQLLRSGTSIGANINEAQAGQSKKDFIAKMSIASKEARESRY